MRRTRFALPFALLVCTLAVCARPAEAPPPPDECVISATTCGTTVVTPPYNPASPETLPGAPQEIEGLHVQARMMPENTALGDGPMSLWAVVTVENTTSQRLTLDTRGCRLKLLAYDRPPRVEGKRAVQATFKEGCYFGGAPVLEPGGTKNVELLAHDLLLASALTDGRYYFDVELTLSGRTLTLPAGSADVRLVVPNLGYRAVTQVLGEGSAAWLQAIVMVENRNDETVFLTYGCNALLMRLYRAAGRTGEPTYTRGLPPGVDCDGYLAFSEVEPGGSLRADEFEVSIPLSEIEGEVEPGYYFVQLSLELDLREKPINAGVLYVAP